LTKSCDVLFLPIELPAKEHNTLFIPGKVFDYVKLRKPILILDQSSDCGQIVKKSGLGLFASNNDVEDIVNCLSELSYNFEEVKNRIRINDEYIESLAFENRAREMSEVFNGLLSSQP
jgi:hypothetical protein